MPLTPTFTPAAKDASNVDPAEWSAVVTSAAVNSAIADNPATSRTAIGLTKAFVNITEHGAVNGALCDTAIANAITAAVSAGHRTVYFPTGDWWINVPIAVNVPNLRFIGEVNSVIIQTTNNHGIELAGTNGAARDFSIKGIGITGPGWSIDKAGIKWANGATYLGDTLTVENCGITEFGNALELGNVNKIYVRNLSSIQCKVGAKMAGTQTWMFIDCRMVGLAGAGAMAGSSCYEISGTMFGGFVLGGEYGGTNVERFANFTSGILHVIEANLEAFSSPQTINMPGIANERKLILRNCRIAVSYAGTTGAMVSCEVNGNFGVPAIEMSGIHGWAGAPRAIEIHGAFGPGGGAILIGGEAQLVTYAATQGGAEVRTVLVRPNARDYDTATSFPVSTALPGTEIQFSPIATTTDGWATNPLFRYRDQNTGTNKWSSQLNDILMRVLYVAGRVASGNNVETDIHNFTLPVGALRNSGESVEIELFGSTAANANNKQFRFYFGGSQYFDFGALPINGESWHLKIIIQRGTFSGGTGYMKLLGVLEYSTGRVIRTAETPNATIDSSATIATRVTALTPTAAADAVSLAAKTIWYRSIQSF